MPRDFNPFAREPLTVNVAGTVAVLPWRPAAVWAGHLDHLSVLAALLAEPDDREALADAVLAHPGGGEQLKHESLRVFAAESGWSWWEAGRLLSTSMHTEVLGRMILAGADPWTRSLGEWCAAVYALCVKGQDERGRIKFDFSLSVPPPGYEDEWDDGVDPAEVTASLAALGVKG